MSEEAATNFDDMDDIETTRSESSVRNGKYNGNGDSGKASRGRRDSRDSYSSDAPKPKYGRVSEMPKVPAMEVTVDHNIEKAMRVLKRKLIREGIFKELKVRRAYEKPSEKKKRKNKEALKRQRKEEARQKKYISGLM